MMSLVFFISIVMLSSQVSCEELLEFHLRNLSLDAFKTLDNPHHNISVKERLPLITLGVKSAIPDCKDCPSSGCKSCQNASTTEEFYHNLQEDGPKIAGRSKVVHKRSKHSYGFLVFEIYETWLRFAGSLMTSPPPVFTKVNGNITLNLTVNLQLTSLSDGTPYSFYLSTDVTCWSFLTFKYDAIYMQAPIIYHFDLALYDCKNKKHMKQVTKSWKATTYSTGKEFIFSPKCLENCSIANLCNSKVQPEFYDNVKKAYFSHAGQARNNLAEFLFKMLNATYGNLKPDPQIGLLCDVLKE